jgi:thiamine biosynthesis lipoprotein
MIEYPFYAMGSHIKVILDSEQEELLAEVEKAADWFEEWEDRLSRFRPESELSQVNRTAGRVVRVSQVFWDVLQASYEANRLSAKLVTPTILPALEAAGYTQSFDQLPASSFIAESSRPAVDGLVQIKRDPVTRSLQLPPDMRLDFGGVAKGWAAHQAMQRLEHLGPVLVDAGGDIAVSGTRTGGQPWLVGVVDPLNGLKELEMLAIGRGGVATSGRDYRHWTLNGIPQHHIIDPRTGRPADTDVLSATVVGPDVLAAEAAAKAVFILGGESGLDWLESRAGLTGLVALEDGSVVYARDSQTVMWRTA